MRLEYLAGYPSRNVAKIVLLHGIDGCIAQTWNKDRSSSAWWTELSQLFDCAVCGIEYESAKFVYNGTGAVTEIEKYSGELLDLMVENDLLSHQTVFIAHSYGGLLLKQALCDSFLRDQKKNYFASRLQNIGGIIFLGTPHHGSNVASFVWPIARMARIATYGLADLRWKTRILKALNKDFEQFRLRHPDIAIINVRETRGVSITQFMTPFARLYFPFYHNVRFLQIVPLESAAIGFPGEINLNAESDHSELTSFMYPGAPEILAELRSHIHRYLARQDDELLSALLHPPDAVGTRRE